MKPNVRLIFITEPLPEFLAELTPIPNGPYSSGSNQEKAVEFAGRVCYDSHTKGRNSVEYHKNILESGHFSVVEHVNLTVFITGISIAMTHELVRHRHLSFSQRSTRYCDPKWDGPAGLEERPDDIADGDWMDIKGVIWSAYNRSVNTYKQLLEHIKRNCPKMERKAARGIARKVIPVCLPTEIVVTGNVRTWREICQKRDIPGVADREIQDVANQMKAILKSRVPHLVTDL